jgi:diaminohydroxyphosphoribosylaminopyrimidine deaminase/5-amino-6-(5-phosphoribosylamino)uracil reductase
VNVKIHEIYIKRCIELAKNGLGTTYPNPLVGSVIVYNEGKIIGEGWHQKSGEAHAEVQRHKFCKRQITYFQNLRFMYRFEPCSHFGKTPPCCDLIIANIKFQMSLLEQLILFEKVAGNGIKRLLENGTECYCWYS